MSETEIIEEEEVSLFDLWEKLREGWRYVIGGLLIGVLGATAVIFIIPNKYEAVTIVQVGQVAQVGLGGLVGQVGQVSSTPVEPPAQAVERMKSSAFQRAVAQALGDQRWQKVLQEGGSSPLALTLVKGALNLIELKAIGDSPAAAQKIANMAIEELAKRQAEIAKPTLDRLTLEASLAKEKLKRAESELESLNKLVAVASIKDDRFTQISLMTNLRVQKEAEIFYQRQMVAVLDSALTMPTTQPARALEDVFVTGKAVSPKKGLVLALGSVGGLLVGMMAVFVSGAWQRARERHLVNS